MKIYAIATVLALNTFSVTAIAGTRIDVIGSLNVATANSTDLLVIALTANSSESNKPACNTANAFAISLSTAKGQAVLSVLSLAFATGGTVTVNGTGLCNYGLSVSNTWETIDSISSSN